MQRVSVVGNSGSGKTRLARRLADLIGADHIELDAVVHQRDWVDLEPAEFRRRVTRLAAEPLWVMDGNYPVVRDLVWTRADTVVWLDPPRWRVMYRVGRRTLARLLLRRELWNGNREWWRDQLSLDPNRSVVAWAWVSHQSYVRLYEEAMRSSAWNHLTFVRLRSEADRRRFLRAAPASRRERQPGAP